MEVNMIEGTDSSKLSPFAEGKQPQKKRPLTEKQSIELKFAGGTVGLGGKKTPVRNVPSTTADNRKEGEAIRKEARKMIESFSFSPQSLKFNDRDAIQNLPLHFGKLSRTEAESLLKDEDKGTYLIRYSDN